MSCENFQIYEVGMGKSCKKAVLMLLCMFLIIPNMADARQSGLYIEDAGRYITKFANPYEWWAATSLSCNISYRHMALVQCQGIDPIGLSSLTGQITPYQTDGALNLF